MANITLSDFRKSYGSQEVIHGLDLDIADGEFVTLVGPSGCGKSTLLRMIAGLEDISAGELTFDGTRVNDMGPAERKIAMVFQSYALYPHMSVRRNLSFGLENLSMPRPEIEARVLAAARLLDIEPYLDRRPKALSGGQRQRVAIGRAIVRNPKVFLFDEPLSNLDAKLRVQTRAEITKLHRQLATTMIYVTHDQVEAMTMSQKIVVLNAGRIEQVGRPLDLFERPANLFVAGFIGSPRMNLFEGRMTGTDPLTVTTDETGPVIIRGAAEPVAEGTKVQLGIRPSHMRRDPEGPMTLTIDQVESMGHETFVYGKVNDLETILHVAGHLSAEPGETMRIALDPDHLHVFLGQDGRALKRVTS